MNKWIIALMIAVLVIGGTGFGGYVYVMKQIHGTEAQAPFRLTVEPGESLKSVLAKLEERGLVGNANWRYVYMRFKQPDYTYQAGEYEIAEGATLEHALKKIKNGEVAKPSTTKITIPEGWTVKQMAQLFADNDIVDEKKFKKLLSDPDYYQKKREEYAFLPPLADGVKSPFEGYLFPETYQFSKDVTEEEVIDEMLSQSQRVVDELALEYPQIADEPHIVFTLASIVEKETTVAEERSRVAGVFFNRLEQDLKLESDATVQYALGKHKDRIMYKDLKIEDPYNTYRNKGLPPGPIASPGVHSLTATLDPEEHDFLFFVTKKDGSQAHYFAKTFTEHKENRKKSEKHLQDE